jgi:hypothetical protein
MAESKTSKKKVTFRSLFKEHVNQTIAYVEGLYHHNKAAQDAAFTGLTDNIAAFAHHLAPSVTIQQEWVSLMTAHTLLVAKLAKGILTCPCPSVMFGTCENGQSIRKTIGELGDNQVLVVAFLSKLLKGRKDDLNHHWTNHLQCTVDYITALQKHGFVSDEYKDAKKHCHKLGRAFGEDLDTWTTSS